MKLWCITGRSEDSDHEEVLHRVYEDGHRPNADEVLAEYLLDECEHCDVLDYYCECGDSDCDYCQNPDSDEAKDYARENALSHIRDDCLYECNAWEVSDVDGYSVRVGTNADASLRGVPSW